MVEYQARREPMKNRLSIVACLLSTLAVADCARFEVVVVDADSGKPMPGVEVTGMFSKDVGWRAVKGAPLPEYVKVLTDKDGKCNISGRTNCGGIGLWVFKPPAGYYNPLDGWGTNLTSKNLFGVWQPDNLTVTSCLQRIEKPIPLFIRKLGDYGYDNSTEDLFSKGDGVLRLDVLKGEWLPPVGCGEVADIEFRRMPREDFGEVYNENILRKGRSYRDSMKVRFLGNDNGLVEMHPREDAGLKIRRAPEVGYYPECVCWSGRGKDLQFRESYDRKRCFCFRVRARRNEKGELIYGFYGKIYGDIHMMSMDGERIPVASVGMLYYLNPEPLDRNLEWDRFGNLCPIQKHLENLFP